MPAACAEFAAVHGEELVRGGLRDELLFHLFGLWDFNLLTKARPRLGLFARSKLQYMIKNRYQLISAN